MLQLRFSRALCRILPALALACSLMLFAQPEQALAACTPDSGIASGGVPATCSGVTLNQGDGAPGTSGTLDGYGAGENGVSVTILPGATVTGDFDGIDLGTGAIIVNNGNIVGTGFDGVTAVGITSLQNNGSIFGDFNGVNATTITSLTNSSTIVGATFDGVSAGSIFSLTNSGTISGGTNAIQETGTANTTLTLLPGSVLIGAIDLGGGVNTLIVGNGLSLASTFATAPVIGSTGGAPFVVSGTQVVVVDPTVLGVHDEQLVDLTGGIFNTVQSRLPAGHEDAAPTMVHGYAPFLAPASEQSAGSGWQAWIEGFGAFRDQDASAPATSFDSRLGGVVSGFDTALTTLHRAGLFLGAATANTESEFDAQEVESDSLFAGLYGATHWGETVIDMALTIGLSNYDQTRLVANNLAPGGLETATASYDALFVSPQVTVTQPLWAGLEHFKRSLTLRYAGLFLDGFTETGTVAPLTVGDRDVHVLLARAQALFPFEQVSAEGTVFRTILNAGIEGRTQFGDDDVSASLLGQNLNFTPGGDDNVAGLFAGAQVEMETTGGMLLYAGVEGQADSDDALSVTGRAGLRISF